MSPIGWTLVIIGVLVGAAFLEAFLKRGKYKGPLSRAKPVVKYEHTNAALGTEATSFNQFERVDRKSNARMATPGHDGNKLSRTGTRASQEKPKLTDQPKPSPTVRRRQVGNLGNRIKSLYKKSK